MTSGGRGSASSILQALETVGHRPATTGSREEKKNYAERLSRELALWVAKGLRPHFKGILPLGGGKGQESKAPTAKGYKKLDVNYSTLELGLALGISIKTIVSRDPSSGVYTKNYSRIDTELRAEAQDYHQRQPFAVMIALIFLSFDACEDGNRDRKGPSSFGRAVQHFRIRANRVTPHHDNQVFERVFIGLYELEGEKKGDVVFFDVMEPPPRYGRPRKGLISFGELINEICQTYHQRNNPPFEWDDGVVEYPEANDILAP